METTAQEELRIAQSVIRDATSHLDKAMSHLLPTIERLDILKPSILNELGAARIWIELAQVALRATEE